MRIRILLAIAAVLAVQSIALRQSSAQVTLEVDRETGIMMIRNSSGASIDLDGYGVLSANGLLDDVNWTRLAATDSDWQAIDGSATEIGELNPLSSTPFADASDIGLGMAFNTDPSAAQAAAGFGVDVEDLVFEYNLAGTNTTFTGAINYSGEKQFNNLVINVDPSTGNIQLENESPESVTIDGFGILSTGGMLDTSWNGLRDTELGWVGGTPGDSVNDLSEQNPLGMLTILGGATYDLGSAFNTAFNPATNVAVDLEDLDLTFEYLMIGEADATAGEVKYLVSGGNGDLDGSGSVNGLDFLEFQRGFGTLYDADDLQDFLDNYGTSPLSAGSIVCVPEPATLVMLTLMAGLCTVTRNRQG